MSSTIQTFAANLRYAMRNRYKLPLEVGGGFFTREEMQEVASALDNPAANFLGYVEARRLTAPTDSEREFWHRLAGNVRKAMTM